MKLLDQRKIEAENMRGYLQGTLYVIINADTKQYFSLLNGGLFTDNVEIAQRFNSETDAMTCTELYIDSDYEKFGMIDTQIINLIK